MKKGEPLFAVVMIARNEANVLPRLLGSLEEFKSRGGEVCLCDTGSTDETVKIAKEWGCKVKEVGDKYVHIITEKEAKDINERFVVDNEGPVVSAGERYFDFSSARNDSASMPESDWICTSDCDEILTKLDIDKINEILENNPDLAHCEYNFCFSHMPDGTELVKFIQSKFYNRTKMKWTNIIHECLVNI